MATPATARATGGSCGISSKSDGGQEERVLEGCWVISIWVEKESTNSKKWFKIFKNINYFTEIK
jgi:hypothetical protein